MSARRHPSARRWARRLPLPTAGCLALALVVASTSGASSSGGFPVVARSSAVATAAATLRAEFKVQKLRLIDLGCVKNGRSFNGHPIVRCSADFGDPHVQAYCTVVIGNRLFTNYDNAAIPCGHDWSGWHVIYFSSQPHG